MAALIRDWLGALFEHELLVYACWLGERRYGTQWTYVDKASSDFQTVFTLLLEIDPAAAGMGGPLLRQRSRLTTTAALKPLHYATEGNDGRSTLTFEGNKVSVTLRDDSRQEVSLGRAEFAFDRALPGLVALMIAELGVRGALAGPTAMEVFDVTQMASVPYKISPGPAETLLTSHRETLELSGLLMKQYAIPAQGLEARFDGSATRLPDWASQPSLTVAPLSYTPPAGRSFRLEDVRITRPGISIGGTLTIPDRPFARAVFLSGSGTHDRHGIAGALDIGTHTIMDTLAEAGVLGLRFDTRGAGNTALGADALELGLDDVIDDARMCTAYLLGRSEGAGRPLYLIGHSQGAIVAMVLAGGKSIAVDGVVLLAAPGRRIDDVIADQLALQGARAGLTNEQIASRLAELREFVHLLETDQPWVEGRIPDYLFPMLRSRHWFRQHIARSPTALIADLRCPVLICQGGKDFQVSAERDAKRLVNAARSVGVDATYVLFPALDHLFKRSSGESTVQSYFDADRRVDGELLDVVVGWLRQRSGGSEPPSARPAAAGGV